MGDCDMFEVGRSVIGIKKNVRKLKDANLIHYEWIGDKEKGAIMSNKTYQRQPNDEVVEFEGKVYCVKEAWKPTDGVRTYSTRGVEAGVVTFDDGTFPAVDIEAFRDGDGSWEVLGVFGPE